MTARTGLKLGAIATAITLAVAQMANAHGGGGGGGHGGGGGGHGGGGHGGGHMGGGHSYGGGGRSFSGGGHSMSPGRSFSGSSPSVSHGATAGSTARSATPSSNSFMSRHGGAGTTGSGTQHQAFHSGTAGSMGGPNGMHSGMNHGGMNGQGMHHHPYNNGGRSYFYGYGSPFGFWGYPGYGFYGFGYPWFWYGLGGYGYGYGRGYGYGNNGYYQPVNQFAVAQQGQQMPQAGGGDATEFASAGEAAFKAGDYQMAVKEWRHALVEAPNNGALVLLLAQGLFATGQYDEAAGAVQHAIQTLPQDKWGLVVANYTELYKSNTDFTNQLRALEAAVEKQSTPANQFLLGYQYGYLGYSKQAVRELDKGLKLAPKDDIARKLRAVFAAKLPADQVPAEPAAASSEPEPTTQAVAPESAAPEATGPALTAAEPNTLP